MGTISDKLSYLAETKRLIKEAMIEKGVNVQDGTPFREYAYLIGELSGDAQFVISDPINVVLSASKWDGHTYSIDLNSTDIRNYQAGTYGVQIGLPSNSSTVNAQRVIEAALTIPYVENRYFSGSSSLDACYYCDIKISAVNIPTEDITISLFGLVFTPVEEEVAE